MNSIDITYYLFDFNRLRKNARWDLKALKEEVHSQFIREARNRKGLTRTHGLNEEKISQVFEGCFQSYINSLSHSLSRMPNKVSLLDLARERTFLLRNLMEESLGIGVEPRDAGVEFPPAKRVRQDEKDAVPHDERSDSAEEDRLDLLVQELVGEALEYT